MSQKEGNSSKSSRSYFLYMVFILMLVQVLDSYTTSFPTLIPSRIIAEFLAGYPENVALSIFTLSTGIGTMGMYVCAVNTYLSDKFGRKVMLIITIFGMAGILFLMNFTTSIVDFTIYLFFLWFFTRSDIWMIYISEEAPKEKRAFWMNIVLIGGTVGAVLGPILRSVYITETSSNWRGLTYFPIIFGVIIGVIALLTLKEPKIFQEGVGDKGLEGKPVSFRKNVKTLLKSPNKKSLIALLIMSFILGANSIFRNLIEPYVSAVGILTEAQISLVILISTLAVYIAFVMIGVLGDKIGRVPLLYLSAIIVPISYLSFIIGSTIPQFALLSGLLFGALASFGYWMGWIVVSMVILEIVPTESRGTGAGLKSLVGAAGITLGFLVTSIFTYSYGLGMAIIVISLTVFLNIPLVYFYIKETKGTDLRDVYGLKY